MLAVIVVPVSPISLAAAINPTFYGHNERRAMVALDGERLWLVWCPQQEEENRPDASTSKFCKKANTSGLFAGRAWNFWQFETHEQECEPEDEFPQRFVFAFGRKYEW